MIDPTTDVVQEHEVELRRQAESAQLAAAYHCYHPTAWRAAAHRVVHRLEARRSPFRAWLDRGEIGVGYDRRSEQPGSGWQYVRPNHC